MRKHVAFVARECSNCERLVQSIMQSDKAKKEIRIVDIANLPPQNLNRLNVVPTIQTQDSRVLEGGKAFEFIMENYTDDTELIGVGVTSSWLGSTLEATNLDSNGVEQISPWGHFEPVE